MTYQEQWDGYRRRRRLVWQVGILYLTVLGLVMEYTKIDGLYVFFLFMVLLAVSGMWFRSWPCPKCGQRYSGCLTPFFFTGKCANCGFPKWHLEDDNKDVQSGSEVDVGSRALAQASAGKTIKDNRGDKRILAALIVGAAIYAAIRMMLWLRAP